MEQPSWQSTLIALAVIALVGVLFWRITDGVDADSFAKAWAGVGTLLGVITGAIPSYFFRAQAEKASRRAEAIAAEASPDVIEAARRKNPSFF
jgi:hypothetical protein